MNDGVWKILIIDDNPDDRAEIRRLLLTGSGRRYKFVEAETGAAGVRQNDGVDCVVLDYHLPDLDAPAVLTEMRQGRELPGYPVVVLTATAPREMASDVLRAGAMDYLDKGWMNPDSLTRAVENAVERYALLRELRDRAAALEDRNRQLDLLARSARLLLTGERPEESARAVFEDLGRLLGMETFYHFQPCPDDPRRLRLRTSGGTSAAERERFGTMRLGELLCGRVAETQTRLVVDDLQYCDQPGSEVLAAAGATSYAGFPLVAGGVLLGTLAFVSRRRTHFRPDEIQAVQAVCDQVATTLERGRLADEARASEERLRLAVEAGGMGTWDLDVRTGRAVWSANHFALLGYPPSPTGEATYQMWKERVHPEDLDRVLAAVERARRERGTFVVEHRVVRADDGRVAWLAPCGRFLYGPDGEAVRFVGVEFDVTERKRAEEGLRASEERFRRAVDATGALIYEVDLSHDARAEAYGLERLVGEEGRSRELSSAWWHARLHPDDLPGHLAHLEKCLADPGCSSYRVAYRVRHSDGSWRDVEDSAEIVRDAGRRPVRLVGAILDVTERKRTEEALKEQDKRKDEFLAMLGHELRNPLAPIRNAVQILRLTGPKEPTLDAARDMIERQVGHLVRLVDDLLDVSRVSRGKIQLQKQPLDLREVARQAVETSRPLVDARRHRLTVTVPPDPVRVEGDFTRLTQVVSNLLNNAAKYTDEGGRIELSIELSVEAARAASGLRQASGPRKGAGFATLMSQDQPADAGRSPHLRDQPADAGRSPGAGRSPHALLRVRDNGRGIDPAALRSLFDLFYQVDRNLDRSEGGLGIGLSLVRSLVEMHGGRVEAHSDGRGKGSEFVIRLPTRGEDAPAPRAEAPDAPGAAARGRRILVVDDNLDSARSMATLLRLDGHEVFTAHDGRQAVAVALRERPAVVLLDIGLPYLDGYQACRAMRDGGLGAALIVAMTGYGQDEDRHRSRAAGFDAHQVKPVDLETIRELLTRQAAGT